MTRRNDRGFTLIEVLVSVTLTSILGGAILTAMFVGIRNLDEANERVAGSNDTQLIASYFTSDVASATAISTTGTRSHEAPGVAPSVADTALVSFWSLKRATTLTLPEGMGPGWNQASAQFRIGMADEATPAAGQTGARSASSADGTSSITHSVALAPVLLRTITRRGVESAATAAGGATKVEVPKPLGTLENDTLLAQVAVAGGPTTSVVAPAGWTLVNSRNSGTVLNSLIFRKLATNNEPPLYEWSFKDKDGPGAVAVVRDAAAGAVAYSNVATAGGVNTHAVDVNPCGGDTPVLLLSWTDRHFVSSNDVDIEVSYNPVPVDTETHLVRRRCTASTGSDLSGLPTSQQTLASNLAPGTPFASCASSPPASVATTTTAIPAKDFCSVLPATVTMSLTEPPRQGEAAGRTYFVRASTRTDREEV